MQICMFCNIDVSLACKLIGLANCLVSDVSVTAVM